MNVRIVSMMAVGALALSAGAYQSTTKANIDLRAAYTKTIDWLGTFTATSTNDPSFGSLQTGSYTLSSDLVTGRLVIDKPNKTVLDLGEGRTMTILGNNTGTAIGTTADGSSSTFQLRSGNIVFPYSYEGVTTYPVLGIPRGTDNKRLHDTRFVVGGGATEARLDTKEIRMLYGTNNCLVVTNNGCVVVSGSGTKFFSSDANDSTGTRNRICVTAGGVYSNSQAGAVLPLSLFGRAGSAGNVFEVTDGGRLKGWERFELGVNAGNVFSFRGAATWQECAVTNKNSPCIIRGKGMRLEVTDGATLAITTGGTGNGRGRVWIGRTADDCSNVVHVAGAGSTFSCESGGVLIGQSNSGGNSVDIRDGGTCIFPNTRIGQGGAPATPAKENEIRVGAGGTLVDPLTLAVGYGDTKPNENGHACSNRLEVLAGGAVEATNLVVSVGTNSCGNIVDVLGGTVSVNGYFDLGYWGQASRMTVCDGGRVTVAGNFNFGQSSDTSVHTSNNVMHVLSGGEVVAKQFIIYGTNHTLVVSNGTIRTRNEKSHGIQLPWYNNSRDWDFTLEVAGTNPVLRAEGTPSSAYVFAIRRGANVLFRVPRTGYVEPPLQAPNGKFGIFDDDNGNLPDLRFDVSACGMHPVRTVIAEGNPLWIKPTTLTRMQANLPENCKLKVADNKLTLSVNEFGTQIIIR